MRESPVVPRHMAMGNLLHWSQACVIRIGVRRCLEVSVAYLSLSRKEKRPRHQGSEPGKALRMYRCGLTGEVEELGRKGGVCRMDSITMVS